MDPTVQRFRTIIRKIARLEEEKTAFRSAGIDVLEELQALERLLSAPPIDVAASLNKIRTIAEGFLTQLCAAHQVYWGDPEQAKPTLERMIGPLRKSKLLPNGPFRQLSTVQIYASPGSHFQTGKWEQVTRQDLQTTLSAFGEFLRWYYEVELQELHGERPRPKWWIPVGVGALVILLSASVWMFLEYRRQQRLDLERLNAAQQAVLTQVDLADESTDLIANKMAKALQALASLGTEHGQSEAEIADLLGKADSPWAIFEFGPAGVAEDRRARVVLDAVGPARTFLDGLTRQTKESLNFASKRPEGSGERTQFAELAAALWALDRFARRDPATAQEAGAVRSRLVESLRKDFGDPFTFDDAQWVPIPAGSFSMGSAMGSNLDEIPVHEVSVDNFKICRHETTNEEFGRFLPAWRSAPSSQPAVGMTWYEAYVYAAWLGARLPTEAEWEYAARDGGDREYPWGDQPPDCSRATFQGCGDATTPVCSKPGGATASGICEMAGNVWEWVADWYDTYPKSERSDPLGPVGPDLDLDGRAVRGGSFKGTAETVRAAKRHAWPPASFNQQTGVRLARDP